MKTNNNFLKSILYVTLVLFAFSCEKPPEPEPVSQEPVMPPLTHTGANTFGCYIDGELFVANEGPSVWSIPPVSGSFDEETGVLLLQGTRYDDKEFLDDIAIQVIGVTEIGDYRLYSEGAELKGYVTSGSENCDYYYNMSNYGFVTVTFFDKTNNIISGNFSMELINLDCSEKKEMKITEGRFDFRY